MNALFLSRVQFGVTTAFHMLWPLLSIGLSFMMVILEVAWLKTKNEVYYRHERFWSKIFILTFGIGVASGLVLEFEFGTNWAGFSSVVGGFFGNILGFEGSMAFALEAAFLAIFIFGWNRVSPRLHLISTILVAFGASLSAWWIMDANSWMQTPTGVKIVNGSVSSINFLQAILNPFATISFWHMWVACIETTIFFVAGISAYYILKKQNIEFFLKIFKISVIIAIFATPLQVYLGDLSGKLVGQYQPATLAAMESHWNTNPAGTGATWHLIAIPDRTAEANSFVINAPIPGLMSFLDAGSFTAQVKGLKDFPPQDRGPIILPFYAFRLMVLIGFIMVFMMIWALWYWFRGNLKYENASRHKWFWKIWYWGLSLGFIATELGWITREVGRQPWIIYGIMRTSEGVSVLTTAQVLTTLVAFITTYVVLFIIFIVFVRKILKEGPDMESPLPKWSLEVKKHA